MNNSGLNAVDFNTDSTGCRGINIGVLNLAAGKAAVKFRSGDTDNSVDVAYVSNDSGLVRPVVEFLSGALRNAVTLQKYTNPTSVTSTTSGLFTDVSSGSTNRFDMAAFPLRFSHTIATGSITLYGPHERILRIDTEASAATDDLNTIVGGHDGQIITINTLANARDVTVKHAASGANTIRLNGAADFTLDIVGDRLSLMYDGVLSQWCETSRSSN